MDHRTPAFIEIKHLSKKVRSGDGLIEILSDVNLVIKHGESVAILGRSGSGKTTLLTLVAGLDVPTHGSILYNTQELSSMTEEQRTLLRGKEIGFVFQSFQLLPTLTALENVMLPLEIHYVKSIKAKEIALAWLERVNLKHRVHHYPAQLSGGEQQRVAIARAFVNQPTLLLADEMTGNLDVASGEKMIDLLFSLNQLQQTTLLLVTHDVSLARRCDRQFTLQNGMLHPC
ncbi:MAG: ABC transporter ATP-binding protein [Gammaproteobacteria bacterium]|nr:ABC transporter ATP-binding protein [Gammaproteobacteria bacterium]